MRSRKRVIRLVSRPRRSDPQEGRKMANGATISAEAEKECTLAWLSEWGEKIATAMADDCVRFTQEDEAKEKVNGRVRRRRST